MYDRIKGLYKNSHMSPILHSQYLIAEFLIGKFSDVDLKLSSSDSGPNNIIKIFANINTIDSFDMFISGQNDLFVFDIITPH